MKKIRNEAFNEENTLFIFNIVKNPYIGYYKCKFIVNFAL